MITIRRRNILGEVIDPKATLRPIVFSAADLALLDGVVFVPPVVTRPRPEPPAPGGFGPSFTKAALLREAT